MSQRGTRKLSNITLTLFLVSLILFCCTQIIINSILSPLGAELEAFNTEKSQLVEYNRELEEELATTRSLGVVKHITEKTLKLSSAQNKQVIYIADDSVRAQK